LELRRIEEATIERAIVHVLDKNSDEPLLTDSELELEPAITAFLTHHILKSLSSEKNRKLKLFNPSGVVYGNLMKIYDDEEDNFVEASKAIAQWLFKCMQEHPIIPSADVIVCQFNTGGARCLAVMKMDYQPSFVHDIQYTEEGFQVDLVSQEISLPSMSQRLNKAAFFKKPAEDEYDLVVVDSPLKAEDGSILEYFQKTFIQASFVVDHMDKTRIVRDQMEKWVRNNMKDDLRNAIGARQDIESVFINQGEMNTMSLTEEIIDDPAKREKFIENLERKGVDTDESFTIDKKWVAKKFKTKALKTDTGFTIRGPFENFNDNAKIEVEYNGDGTVNYIIKGVRNISER